LASNLWAQGRCIKTSWIKDGDTVEVEIESVGVLRNKVVAGE
jgi:2-keto-4-pentenoate hydratase/2-oxohepta-3-ene-1,7-dioic acid hydratase in catechol pathway|tara:strand:+ start:1564 stop:1689 length:126 start_codon:yes stop_codon:yes gene_type:complete